MNRKFEDIKINKINKPAKKAPEVAVFVKNEQENHNPTIKNTYLSSENSTKYNFLNKINKKTEDYSPRISQTPHMPYKKRSFSGIILFLFILSLIIGGVYLFSTVLLRANITVVSNNKNFELNNSKFLAGKNNSIPFELMIISDSKFENIILSSYKELSEKAKGDITLFNEFSTNPQKLVAGTFISDEDGKTYKTESSISIPGYTLDKEKNIIPGQISVKISSFLPGESYNGEPKLFTINSFKNTTKFKKIYGKADTPIEGGVVGLVYILDEEIKQKILSKTDSLKENLSHKLSVQVPDGYILYPNSTNFSYEFDENMFSKTPDVKIKINGTLSAFLIKESDLSNFVINRLLPDISNKEKNEILQPDLNNLVFNFVNKNQIVGKDVESFEFELAGTLFLKWNPYIDELKELLVSKNKDEISLIFKQDPGIASASAKIIPFWSKKLPKDINNINIILK